MIYKLIKNFVLPFMICIGIAIALYPNVKITDKKYEVNKTPLSYDTSKDLALHIPKKAKLPDFSPKLGKTFIGFKEALAFKESRGNYFTVNTLGYLGKYQFGTKTLKRLGVTDTAYFLKTPELQEKAFVAYLMRNKWILRKEIKKYNGKVVAGVKVTESGILAAAHLSGAGSVVKFLKSNGQKNSGDAYGSTVKHFMQKFSGYDTSVIKAKRNAKVKP